MLWGPQWHDLNMIYHHTKSSNVPFQSGPPGMTQLVAATPQPLHLSTNPKLLTCSMMILIMIMPMIMARIYLNLPQICTIPSTITSPITISILLVPQSILANSQEHAAFLPITLTITVTPTPTIHHPLPPNL